MWTATSQISEMNTPLDHAQEEAMSLVKWALCAHGARVLFLVFPRPVLECL